MKYVWSSTESVHSLFVQRRSFLCVYHVWTAACMFMSQQPPFSTIAVCTALSYPASGIRECGPPTKWFKSQLPWYMKSGISAAGWKHKGTKAAALEGKCGSHRSGVEAWWLTLGLPALALHGALGAQPGLSVKVNFSTFMMQWLWWEGWRCPRGSNVSHRLHRKGTFWGIPRPWECQG